MKYLARGLVAGLVLVLISGCAATRSRMTLEVPAPGSGVVSGGKPVVIDAVRDARSFETDPDSPSTPSLKKGSDYTLNAEQRKSAIGRKRNGFGHAWGDVLLEPGQDVETLTRQLLVNAFAARGYSVVDASSAPADAPHVSADIREFWSWFVPGFWSASIDARVTTLLKIDSPQGRRQVTVTGYGHNAVQVGREANWQLAYHRAFEDYLKQFDDAATTTNGL